MPQPTILLSRDGYSHAPQKQLNKLVASLQAAQSDIFVLGAMVEKGQSSLPESLQQCAETGVRHITVLPVFLPGDDNLQRWLAKVIRRWRSQCSGEAVEICLANSLGNHPALQTAVVEAIAK
ncbi:MAG: CbiX/SirB N-terminal domain-containing protein [Chloroflexota bacterium]